MADAKNVIYSPELTGQIVSAYQAGTAVEEIAETIGKSVSSVRSKLVREGVYVAKEKPAARKVEGPSKKEILRDLDATGFDTAGFQGATKDALTRLLGMVAN